MTSRYWRLYQEYTAAADEYRHYARIEGRLSRDEREAKRLAELHMDSAWAALQREKDRKVPKVVPHRQASKAHATARHARHNGWDDAWVLTEVAKAKKARKAAYTRATRIYMQAKNEAFNRLSGPTDVEQAARQNAIARAQANHSRAIDAADARFHARMDEIRQQAPEWADIVRNPNSMKAERKSNVTTSKRRVFRPGDRVIKTWIAEGSNRGSMGGTVAHTGASERLFLGQSRGVKGNPRGQRNPRLGDPDTMAARVPSITPAVLREYLAPGDIVEVYTTSRFGIGYAGFWTWNGKALTKRTGETWVEWVKTEPGKPRIDRILLNRATLWATGKTNA